MVKPKLSADAERRQLTGMDETAHRLLADTQRLRRGANGQKRPFTGDGGHRPAYRLR